MAIKKPTAEGEAAPDVITKAVRPVKLKAVKYKIRSPESGVLYTPHAPVDLNDFNAPASYFERAQVREGVLVIVEG